ncbi:MAG TPA: hypothetical protein VJ953_22180 [Saprospiraceae bacterium]|nr:hypothetical protein [Saprospiraceae bacterium]
MKKNNRLQTLLLILAVFAISSCNRGYGCPTNFSIDDISNIVIQWVQYLV